jgi:hypothetical protein
MSRGSTEEKVSDLESHGIETQTPKFDTSLTKESVTSQGQKGKNAGARIIGEFRTLR